MSSTKMADSGGGNRGNRRKNAGRRGAKQNTDMTKGAGGGGRAGRRGKGRQRGGKANQQNHDDDGQLANEQSVLNGNDVSTEATSHSEPEEVVMDTASREGTSSQEPTEEETVSNGLDENDSTEADLDRSLATETKSAAEGKQLGPKENQSPRHRVRGEIDPELESDHSVYEDAKEPDQDNPENLEDNTSEDGEVVESEGTGTEQEEDGPETVEQAEEDVHQDEEVEGERSEPDDQEIEGQWSEAEGEGVEEEEVEGQGSEPEDAQQVQDTDDADVPGDGEEEEEGAEEDVPEEEVVEENDEPEDSIQAVASEENADEVEEEEVEEEDENDEEMEDLEEEEAEEEEEEAEEDGEEEDDENGADEEEEEEEEVPPEENEDGGGTAETAVPQGQAEVESDPAVHSEDGENVVTAQGDATGDVLNAACSKLVSEAGTDSDSRQRSDRAFINVELLKSESRRKPPAPRIRAPRDDYDEDAAEEDQLPLEEAKDSQDDEEELDREVESYTQEDLYDHMGQRLPGVVEDRSPVKTQVQREAISLALKDIQNAIAQSKKVTSPYSPEPPSEPVWVMREPTPTPEDDKTPDTDEEIERAFREAQIQRERQARERLERGVEEPVPPRRPNRSDLNAPMEPKTMRQTSRGYHNEGPQEVEDLIDGITFAARYLGSTQIWSDRNPSKNVRMLQAQEAVSRIKRIHDPPGKSPPHKVVVPEDETQPSTEIDLSVSTEKIQVINATSQEVMMDHALRTISYIADIGTILVIMARRRPPRPQHEPGTEVTAGHRDKKQHKIICHVFEAEEAQLIAQSIGQCFQVAYQEFLRANGITEDHLSQMDYQEILNSQEIFHEDLEVFSNSENAKEVVIDKPKGEIMGLVIVESGWGSILPTVIIANMMHGGPAERSGKLNIGDQLMTINDTSLVGLPLHTCQGIIKGLKNHGKVRLNIVQCPPVTTVLVKRPDIKYQLGFSVQNGIICSLMRGGIAERGGVRVGHRIIEINGQSVVATAHEKIVSTLANSVGEIHMKTMPQSMYRLLTGQEQPIYI
ncbi:amyloid-beta A4 precursor protein-binding family A member 2-like isoform X2 [Branchiostoma lanceolatum]|uniref:amyloid-beta A4 precursor protein-binding family A member 2-like isoform X2 n=1 Tax=Branchiostoma lanceolatum TaxID=7740 RepID=UPI0034559042